jgi:hypothetical protein
MQKLPVHKVFPSEAVDLYTIYNGLYSQHTMTTDRKAYITPTLNEHFPAFQRLATKRHISYTYRYICAFAGGWIGRLIIPTCIGWRWII